ncbi:MAG: hypothetical protein ACOY71_06560 [Gemmatimonadota bacterium]
MTRGALRFNGCAVSFGAVHGQRRKNLILDQGKMDRAKELLGASTETEAITRALDAVTELARFRAELETGFRSLVGRGGFEDVFASSR